MSKIRIVFKSGYVQELKAEEFKIETNRATGKITCLTWKNTKPRLMDINLEEIAAVFEL